MTSIFLQISNFSQGRFSIEEDYYFGEEGEYGDLWQHLCSRFEKKKNGSPKGLLPALLPCHKARYFEFKTKGDVIAGTIWLLQALPLL